ncbi:MAG TPA: CoA ester lyase [Candidatus Binataceae bacterium]|nr:CoA ester lyase [Candidatus Binataceae bacterium]
MSLTTHKPRRFRLQRSELAVPATSPHFFPKAAHGDADVIFLDLEDAVAPEQKVAARANAITALKEIDWGQKTVAVRVNGLDTPWSFRDILDIALNCPRLDMFMLPKAGTAFDVRFVDTMLGQIERDTGRKEPFGLEVLIETALGMSNVEEIAASSERLEAMIFGVGDYSISMQTGDVLFGSATPRYSILTAADERGERVRHWNDKWHFALARMANACRAYGMRAIDGPYVDYADVDGYRASAERAAALGLEGKWAIHPSQVAIANEVFTPSPEQLEWARRLVATMKEAVAQGRGAASLDGKMIDMAHFKVAEIIERKREAIARRG